MDKSITEESKTLITITRHRALVEMYLGRLAVRLKDRATSHDLSKYTGDEFTGFVEINRIAREHEYGSPEYMESIKGNEAVSLHYSRNPHHPDHHAGGIFDMSLVDIVEMVADWKAASVTYGQTSLEESLEVSRERFGITDVQMCLIRMIIETMKDNY